MRRIDPVFQLLCQLRIQWQARHQQFASNLGFARQQAQVGPGRFRIDMVGCHRRNAAEVVDPRADQSTHRLRRQVRRGLDVGLGAEDDPRHCDGPAQLLGGRFFRIGHLGVRLATEVLDDDFLNVAICVIEIAQRQQRLDALAGGFRRCR